jgi:hypothetical protein
MQYSKVEALSPHAATLGDLSVFHSTGFENQTPPRPSAPCDGRFEGAFSLSTIKSGSAEQDFAREV